MSIRTKLRVHIPHIFDILPKKFQNTSSIFGLSSITKICTYKNVKTVAQIIFISFVFVAVTTIINIVY